MQAAKAKVLELPTSPEAYRLNPQLHERVKGNGRAIAVAMFRDLANRLESGELDCARIQWLDTHGLCVEVDVDGVLKQLACESPDEVPDGAQPVSGLEFVTRSAWSAEGSGTVQFNTTTIEEV